MPSPEKALWKLKRGNDFAEARLRELERGLQLRLVMWGAGEKSDDPHVLWSQTFRDGQRSDRAARTVAETTRAEMMSRGWSETGEAAV